MVKVTSLVAVETMRPFLSMACTVTCMRSRPSARQGVLLVAVFFFADLLFVDLLSTDSLLISLYGRSGTRRKATGSPAVSTR